MAPPPAPAAAIDDEQRFLAFVRTRDAAVLESLLRAHADRAYSQARHLLAAGADAEDAVQEAFLQLVRTADRYDGSVPFAAWLGRLVYVSALAIARSRTRRLRREREALAAQVPPRRDDDAELKDRIRQAVGELPETYRAPLVLHYFSGLDQRGTAAALGISVDAVAMRLSRAREKLRSTLKRAGVAVPALVIADALAGAPAHAAPASVGAAAGSLVAAVTSQAPLPLTTIPAAGLGWALGAWIIAGVVALAATAAMVSGVVRGSAARPAPPSPLAAAAARPRQESTYIGSFVATPGPPTLHLCPMPDGSMYFLRLAMPATRNTVATICRFDGPDRSTDIATIEDLAHSEQNPLRLASDQSLWCLERQALVRVERDGRLSRFRDGLPATAELEALAPGPAGEMWFWDRAGRSLDRVTPAGAIAVVASGLPDAKQVFIALGPDQRMYAAAGRTIGVVDGSGSLAVFKTLPDGVEAWSLAAGDDGCLWFGDHSGDATRAGRIWRLSLDGSMSAFPISTAPFDNVRDLVRGPLGRLWFSHLSGSISAIDPQGRITDYRLPLEPNWIPYSLCAETGYPTASSTRSVWVIALMPDRLVELRLRRE